MVQYTVRNVPKHVDKALRERARRENKSMNALALEVLANAVAPNEPAVKIDLSDVAGTWVEDPEVDWEEFMRSERQVLPQELERDWGKRSK